MEPLLYQCSDPPGRQSLDLADKYRQGSGYSRQEYIDELKRMNGLKSEQLHSGEYLTVVYFAE